MGGKDLTCLSTCYMTGILSSLSYNFHSNTLWWDSLFPFHKLGKQGSERLTIVLNAKQLITGGGKMGLRSDYQIYLSIYCIIELLVSKGSPKKPNYFWSKYTSHCLVISVSLEPMAFFHLEYLHVFAARTPIHLWDCCGKSQDCLK